MKNRLPHLIAMLLACLMLLSSVSILAGCAKEDAPDTETSSGQNGTAGETSTEYVPDIAKKNYNTTFNVVAIGFNEDLLILDEDKKRDGNSLDEAVYERGVLVKEQLGVECKFADAGDWISYSGKIANTVQTGDDAYQLVLTHRLPGRHRSCHLQQSDELHRPALRQSGCALLEPQPDGKSEGR